LNFFAVLVFLWLQAEIMFYSRNNPLPLLEWGGKWSYSIYLGHVLAQPFFIRIGFVLNLGAAGPILNWFGEILVVLIFCWLFYVIVEFPSHRLARLVSRKLSQPIII
jgi:peptidoglycan/LPS O-acetylase OafA/YrhL